jgi:outer membrane protein OmpA-like peptidoglycan-associated protein
MSAAPVSAETSTEGEAEIVSKTSKNKEIIEKLFEDSKTTLKNEHDNMINKIKEDLNKSKQQAIIKLKKL